MGATADVTITKATPVVENDPSLTARMVPTLERYARHAVPVPPWTASEDFAFFGKKVPSLFVFLGVTPDSVKVETAAPNHSPRFFADESALPYGVQVMSGLAVDYLTGKKATP